MFSWNPLSLLFNKSKNPLEDVFIRAQWPILSWFKPSSCDSDTVSMLQQMTFNEVCHVEIAMRTLKENKCLDNEALKLICQHSKDAERVAAWIVLFREKGLSFYP